MKRPLLALVALLSLPAARSAEPAAGSALAAAASPAPLTRDLGRNLAYLRPHALPADLPDPNRKQPLILDLRYLRAADEAVAAFHRWVKAHASPRSPLFVLANADTDRDLVAPLTSRASSGSVLVIGAAARNFSPDIAVTISPADERRAYDALAAGTDWSVLLTENPDKVRNDEASLSRDRSTSTPDLTDTPERKDPSPPIDAALQRAVHLHRTLVALRKL